MRIVFFGTPNFSKIILEYLFDQKVEIAAVITRPDKPRGRSNKPASSPVKEYALSHHLLLYQPPKASDPEFAAFLKTLHADFFVVAAYAEILKENILEIPRLGCINVHGSILPKYRGAAPVPRSIMEGETETGVTIMKMALQMDAGAILAIRKLSIPLEMTAGELMESLANVGKSALIEVLQEVEQGRSQPIEQDLSAVTYAKKLTPQDAQVNWNPSSLVVHNQIRGCNPNPGAWCWIKIKGDSKRLLIKKSLPLPSPHGQPGEIISGPSSELFVACGSGAISLLEVQLEGKKQMSIGDFLRGTPLSQIKFN